MCLGNILKDFSVDNIKNIELLGDFYSLKAVPLNAVPLNLVLLKCASINNQECKVIPEIININSNESFFCPYSIKGNKSSDSCNNTDDPYSHLCVPDVVKNINVKVFNIMWRSNETRHIKWHETCKCICRLDSSGFDNKQRWNNDKCRCKCKELIEKKNVIKNVFGI